MTHPDELDALRQAFRSLPLPEPTPPLAEADAQTQDVVDWMRAAFAALPVPDAALPAGLFAPHPTHSASAGSVAGPRPRLPLRWLRHAAAVLIFAGLAALLQLGSQAPSPQASPVVDSSPPGVGVGVDTSDPTRTLPTRPSIPGFRAAPTGGSGLIANADGQLELRSGPVRLVLVTSHFAPDTRPAPPR